MKELLAKMNKALQVLSDTRINDFGEFHNKIDAIITPLIPKEFEVGVWEIKSVGLFMLHDDTAFELKIDFIDDKRSKLSNRRGRLIKCWYEQIFEGQTVQKIIANQKKSSLTIAIKNQRDYIAKLKTNLSEAENCLHDLITKGEEL